MTTKDITVVPQDFASDVRDGLSAPKKHIPCVYFYDDRGSELFAEICRQPEYYLTRAETEILSAHSADIANLFPEKSVLIELGSGNSTKILYLIEAFLKQHHRTHYIPIDVAESMLEESTDMLLSKYPGLTVSPIAARYEDGLAQIEEFAQQPKLLLWLGGSIGNLSKKNAAAFLRNIARPLKHQDALLIGIDLYKDKARLEAAYNDAAGVTAQFNLNLLRRINNELGGSFNLERFSHQAIFNEDDGRIEMYLKSTAEQTVKVDHLKLEFQLDQGELIHTENSYKYRLEEIDLLAERIGLLLKKQWLDSKRRFSLNLFTAKHP